MLDTTRWGLRLKSMSGRAHNEQHRVATTLELLYDLSFVVVLSVCGVQLAHAGVSGHLLPGLVAFLLVQVAAIWAWMNYTWFASGFDTDDWGVRLAVGLQMVGIIIFATGIPEFFEGMNTWQPKGGSLAIGYVVVRVAMVALWFRVARSTKGDPYGGYQRALWTALIQAGWVLIIATGLARNIWYLTIPLIWLAELSIPLVLEQRYRHVPFHPHHLAERFGLLTIISLGEIVVGTAEATATLYEHHGWATSTIMMVATGISLALSLWWIYFALLFGDALHHHRPGVTVFSYLHIGVFMMIAAIGAGIHVAAEAELAQSSLGTVKTVAAIAIPNALLLALLYTITFALAPRRTTNRTFHTGLLSITLLFLAGAVGMAALGVGVTECLILIVLAPIAQIIGLEVKGRAELKRAATCPTPGN